MNFHRGLKLFIRAEKSGKKSKQKHVHGNEKLGSKMNFMHIDA